MDPLVTPIEYLKGVGPQRAELLRSELNVHTYIDLLQHFPFRYVDRSKFHRVAELHEEMPQAQLRGVLGPLRTMGEKQGRRLTATFSDPSGSVELVWFKGVRWLHTSLKPGQEYILFGKPNVFKGRFNFPHPELELAATWEKGLEAALQPVYRTTEKLTAKGLGSRAIWKLQKTALEQVAGHVPETLSSELVEWLGGVTRDMAFRQIHAPQDQARSDAAIHRLKFEELFFLQLRLLKQKLLLQHQLRGNVFTSVGQHFNSFYTEHLPFELTGAQKRVVKEIRKDMGTGHQMNRLLQGDVGSGKTLVATAEHAHRAGQRFPDRVDGAHGDPGATALQASLSRDSGGPAGEVRLLTGSTKAAERKSLLKPLQVGRECTSSWARMRCWRTAWCSNLGLVVIDEQHRFGVAATRAMQAKAAVPAACAGDDRHAHSPHPGHDPLRRPG
jgi:ATP-dependent DNA helicase RecG